jgi:Tfp pilus assembly protein PilX
MNNKTTRAALTNNEQGMVAIIVTTVLMMVISLIVLGFTQTVRREQSQSLERQLSTQAFYAAESGVNLARKVIDDQLKNGEPVTKDSCEEGTGRYSGKYAIDSSTGSTITCLLVKSELPTYEYQGITTESQVTQLTGAGGALLRDIVISWQSTTLGTYTGCASVPTPNLPAAWGCSEPLLRVDIVPLSSSMSPASLRASQYTSFLYPVTGASPSAISSVSGMGASIGTISPVSCASAPFAGQKYRCTAVITMAVPVNSYGLRMMGIYKPTDVSVAARGITGTPVNLVDGQVLVDSTAKAIDVLRRIQARITLTSGADDVPDYAITSGGGLGICKQYTVSGAIVAWPAIAACAP